jgi:hypothetical protein
MTPSISAATNLTQKSPRWTPLMPVADGRQSAGSRKQLGQRSAARCIVAPHQGHGIVAALVACSSEACSAARFWAAQSSHSCE